MNSKVNGYYYRATSTNDESGKPQKREGVPSDCFIVDRNGTAFTKDGRNYKQICDYAKVNVPNLHKDSSGKSAFFSYREAYCQALGPNKTSPFKDYCSGIEGNKLCPPSSDKQSFDSCVVENVRPAFRYNLK